MNDIDPFWTENLDKWMIDNQNKIFVPDLEDNDAAEKSISVFS